MISPTHLNKGWRVALAGIGINLALGVLYTWSMFKGAIEKDFGWKGSQLNDPYALCCLVFAFSMILAGRCQDKLGPRVTATIGGLLVAAGFALISTTNSYGIWVIGFGVLAGIGIGFGYSSATPPALKWFPPNKTGLIAGIVVAGFGLAPLYLAPASDFLLRHFGLLQAMLFFGVLFAIIVCGLSQLLVNPPAGYSHAASPSTGESAAFPTLDLSTGQIIRTPLFWLLWVLYFIGAGAGLMVISSISGMAKKSMGESAFIAVVVMAIGNAGGRLVAGILSDRIGRRWTLMLVLLIQAALMFAAIPITSSSGGAKYLVVLVASFIGFNYGANLSIFPSLAKDLWGLKNFGMNYGCLFTAWGVGGFALSRLQQMLKASSGSFNSSFITAGLLLILGAGLTFLIKSSEARPPDQSLPTGGLSSFRRP